MQVYELLFELRGGASVTADAFFEYLKDLQYTPHAKIMVFADAGRIDAMATMNRLEMPRYVGFAWEIEELAVREDCRGIGTGTEFLMELIAEARREPRCRKIIVKTDSAVAKRLYRKCMAATELVVFQSQLNPC
ncbi:MAG TPA: GNAT family N-acetyltransferase [Gemmatimonadaceae bacterium]|nr:GNAT family N-acetyltransferase [Gemmatimonadaceae bacterium]